MEQLHKFSWKCAGGRGVLLITFNFFPFREELFSSAALGRPNASFFGGVEPTLPAIGRHADRGRPTRYLVAAPSRLFEKKTLPPDPHPQKLLEHCGSRRSPRGCSDTGGCISMLRCARPRAWGFSWKRDFQEHLPCAKKPAQTGYSCECNGMTVPEVTLTTRPSEFRSRSAPSSSIPSAIPVMPSRENILPL